METQPFREAVPVIVLDIGLAHMGDHGRARELVAAAAAAGADAVKFQVYYANDFAPWWTLDQLRERTALQLRPEQYAALAEYAREAGLSAGASFLDWGWAAAAVAEFLDFLKIPSRLRLVAPWPETALPVFASCGQVLPAEPEPGWTYFACNFDYSGDVRVPIEQIRYLSARVPVWGYSCHDRESWENALGLGASHFEFHLALDDKIEYDRNVSLRPDEAVDVVRTIRGKT